MPWRRGRASLTSAPGLPSQGSEVSMRHALDPATDIPMTVARAAGWCFFTGVAAGVLYVFMKLGGRVVGGSWGAVALPAAAYGAVLTKSLCALMGRSGYEAGPVNVVAIAFGLVAVVACAVLGARVPFVQAVLVGGAGGAALATVLFPAGKQRLAVGAATAGGYALAVTVSVAVTPAGPIVIHGLSGLVGLLASYLIPFGVGTAAAGVAYAHFAPKRDLVAEVAGRQTELYDYESEGMRERAMPQVSTAVPEGRGVVAVSCPNCGGSLDPNKRVRRQECPYCGTALAVE